LDVLGTIARPDINSPDDITRLGEARLFWGVTTGSLDSMVANTTALGKPRRSDDYTPGGVNNRRQNRVSLRRVAHSNLLVKLTLTEEVSAGFYPNSKAALTVPSRTP